MTESPPTQSDAEQADDAALSVQEQLDQLLTQIETEEPGTIDQAALPKGFQSQAPEKQASPAAQAPSDPFADAMASFEEALDTDPTANDDDIASQTERDREQTDDPSTVTAEAPEPPTQADAPVNDSEADMLAALNAALQDLNPDTGQNPIESVANDTAAQAPADPPAQPSMETKLQDEINALLAAPIVAEPEVEQESETQAPATPASETNAEATDAAADVETDGDAASTAQTPPSAELSTQDQIANEIQSLLDTEPAAAPASTDAAADAPGDADPSMDELDRMLADEIDEDDELAGDFESVESITAGIDTGQPDPADSVDEHAASARDVAAELDSQPEDTATTKQDEDPFAAIAEIAGKAERNAEEHDRQQARPSRTWAERFAITKRFVLGTCYRINWPARRFLSYEWRETLGYISLTVAFSAVAIWIYVIVL